MGAVCQDQGSRLLAPETATLSVTASLVDPALATALQGASATDQLEIIATFDATQTTGDAIGAAVQATGAGALGFLHLPMVAALATPVQIEAIAALPGVRGVFLNELETALNFEGRASLHADDVHGLGVTGKGVGVAILDSGIDGMHPDLLLGSKTVQNVEIGANSEDVYTFEGRDTLTGLKTPKPLKKGYEIFVENVSNTDDNGHGTHVAGTVAGTGSASNGRHKGVAPGAHLIGIGVGAGGSLPAVQILAGYDYIIEHQKKYNIQVVNNSWGSSGRFNPEEPIPLATKAAYNAGITVVFAAGNEGPNQNTMNRRSVAPWVISVAAGCKLMDDTNAANWQRRCLDANGRAPVLASFSSRGIPGDPLQHPDITAPGVLIVSAKNTVGVQVWGTAILSDLRTCNATEYIQYYTCISGTSMASPMIAGVVALMEEASGGTLTPDQALSALTRTAQSLAGYAEWEVGAGYADALAAVRAVKR